MKNSIAAGSLAIIGAALLWSLDGVFLQPQLYALPVTLVVFLEHALGFVVLAPALWYFRFDFKKITRKQWLTIFWVALFGGALGTTFFTKALFLTNFKDLSVVLLLQKFQPIFAIVLASFLLKERFPKSFYIYAALAIVGGYFVTFRDPFTLKNLATTSAEVALYALLAAFAWGSATTFGKYSLKNIHYGLLTALRYSITIIIMLVLARDSLNLIPHSIAGRVWFIMVIIVFTSGAAAMYLYYYGLKKVTASVATLCELAEPFSAVLLDFALNHTVLGWTQYLGALALVAAVYRVMQITKPRTITGVVNYGQGQGDKIGAKTANLELALANGLPKGLYLTTVSFDGTTYDGLLYHGINSLTNTDCLEVHLLNFSGDLYGKTITVQTMRYLRFPKKFTSAESLARQIQKDFAFLQKL